MHTDLSQSSSTQNQATLSKPGEIWEVSRSVQTPVEFSDEQQQHLYSETAQLFLDGIAPRRFVIITGDPEPPVDPEEPWQVVSVMLLSRETEFLSNVDLLIPSEVSGIDCDLIAETWHILPMLTCNLLRPVGKRLSRTIYDVLLTVGDFHNGLADEIPSKRTIESLGLTIATTSFKQPNIQAFHQREVDWSDVLSIPFAAYYTYLKATGLTDSALNAAIKLEREFSEVWMDSESSSELISTAKQTNNHNQLRNWFRNQFETGWMAIEEFLEMRTQLALACRSAENYNNITSDDITSLIHQLDEPDELQQRTAAKQLGAIAVGHQHAIQALVHLRQTTQDDETLWTVVESLWQIDPGNPAAGVRRVKLIDLGMQVAGQSIALAVTLIHKPDQQVGILLRVYPTGDAPYLPASLQLILLKEIGRSLYEVTARQADMYIQLRFSGRSGEQFGVRVTLGNADISENFTI
ncbi:MAG: DUF1822 family protein [Cyanobacteria bacterium CRU_2_1]|nr:DUF1822 family protein [Cyanobacteria bacterium RU_5_0]NJR61779.1 DUF1822 family protein [Cyanobacteria bacterium CRU_2_1]